MPDPTVLPVIDKNADVEAALVGIDAANGNAFDNSAGDGRFWLDNRAGSDVVTITVPNVGDCSYGGHPDFTKELAAGQIHPIDPFDPHRYNDRTTKRVTVTYAGSDLGPVKAAASKWVTLT